MVTVADRGSELESGLTLFLATTAADVNVEATSAQKNTDSNGVREGSIVVVVVVVVASLISLVGGSFLFSSLCPSAHDMMNSKMRMTEIIIGPGRREVV